MHTLAVASWAGSHGHDGLQNLDTFASALEHIATVLALIAGGLFTYFKFVKDRIYRPRLDFSIDAGRVTLAEVDYLLTRVSVKNLGVSKIQLAHKDTGVHVYISRNAAEDYRFVAWEKKAYGDLFLQHEWIEAGETISDDALLRIPSDRNVAYYVEARVIVRHRRAPIECVGRQIFPGSWEFSPLTTDRMEEV